MCKRELGTVLAALRLWQHVGCLCQFPDNDQLKAIDDTATAGGQHERLTSDEIDALCECLNCSTVRLSEDDVITEVIRDDEMGLEAGMTVKQLLDVAGNMIDHCTDTPVTYFKTRYSEQVWVGTVELCLTPASPEAVDELGETAESGEAI